MDGRWRSVNNATTTTTTTTDDAFFSNSVANSTSSMSPLPPPPTTTTRRPSTTIGRPPWRQMRHAPILRTRETDGHAADVRVVVVCRSSSFRYLFSCHTRGAFRAAEIVVENALPRSTPSFRGGERDSGTCCVCGFSAPVISAWPCSVRGREVREFLSPSISPLNGFWSTFAERPSCH